MTMNAVLVPRLLRVREAAEMTGLERWRLYDLIKRGEGPPHLRVGRTIRIPDTSLARWVEERAANRGRENAGGAMGGTAPR